MLDQLQFPTPEVSLGERRFYELRALVKETMDNIEALDTRVKDLSDRISRAIAPIETLDSSVKALDARLRTLSGLLPTRLNEILDAIEKMAPAPAPAPDEPEAPVRSRAARMSPNSAPVVRATWYQPNQPNSRAVTAIYVHRKLIDLAGFHADDRIQVWVDGEVLVIARNPAGRRINKWADACATIRSTDLGQFSMPESPAEVSPGVIRVRIPSRTSAAGAQS